MCIYTQREKEREKERDSLIIKLTHHARYSLMQTRCQCWLILNRYYACAVLSGHPAQHQLITWNIQPISKLQQGILYVSKLTHVHVYI